MPIAMVNFHVLLGKYRINCRGRHVFSVRSCTWAQWTMKYKRGEHAIFPRLELVHMCWLGWRLVPSSPSSLGCCHDQLCWNLKSIMALWVSACKTKVPFQVVESITRGVVVVFSVKLVHKHEWKRRRGERSPKIGEATADALSRDMSVC